MSYVFCVVESLRPPSVQIAGPTLPSAGPPRVLSLDRNMWLVAADAPLQEYSKTAIEHCLKDLDCVSARALAHQATIARFFERWPVIPLKLFTIFASDERAITHLRSRTKHIRRLFDSVRDHQEWGARFIIDRAPVPPRVEEIASASGRDYLKLKQGRRNRSAQSMVAARKEATAALRSLGKLAAQTRRLHRSTVSGGSRSAVLEAAYLVPLRRSKAWTTRARTLGARVARYGWRIEITGPWPPYNFVSPRHS